MSSLQSARTHLIRARQTKDWAYLSKSIYSIRYDKGSLDFNTLDAGTIMMNVTVRQLQIFCEAGQQLSFACVAARLHLSLAGVCFQIKQIESANHLKTRTCWPDPLPQPFRPNRGASASASGFENITATCTFGSVSNLREGDRLRIFCWQWHKRVVLPQSGAFALSRG